MWAERARRTALDARAVIFDLDDTLLMTREVKWAHHKAVAERYYGIRLTDEELERHWGRPFDELITALYRASATVDEMRAANRALESQYLKPAAPGALDLVEHLLDRDVEVGVLTSANTSSAVADLDRTGFSVDRLRFVQGADASAVHKPDPGVFDAARTLLGQFGVEGDRIVYVGDAMMDLEAARGAGLGFVGVATGLVPGERFTREGVGWVNGLSDLMQEAGRGPA
jgi:HAD superfamily hydrolase (TIGR01549 family)